MQRAAILIGIVFMGLASCEPDLVAGKDRAGNGDYEVVALIAE